MKTFEVIALARTHLTGLSGRVLDVIEVAKPSSTDAATNLAKIISKLSPLVGNLIEFNTCEYLNKQPAFKPFGKWHRQDPGFPDTVFVGKVDPTPGFEIKAWFPLATEITARFKDSQNHFADDRTHVAMLAWLPEYIIFGKPRILDIVVVPGKTIAKARDDHYHNPPDYLVLEPEDTAARTTNLQQTNTNGYKFQGTAEELSAAEQFVAKWGPQGRDYEPTPEYQARLRQLMAQFPAYRLDTNFAKMDRIRHSEIEAFKSRVLDISVHGRSIAEWTRLLTGGNETAIAAELASRFGIN
jgi:hypothetical protein